MSNKYEAALGPFNDKPEYACRCWSSAIYYPPAHDGHCCWVYGADCHETEGRELYYSIDPGDPR